ncbi:glycosyltransferase family 2 protein [Desertivirga xinjiangensis]|uniref:glycosyltransferase family 2 protein n=1 Tax=Desertivirga xinjiangensis TaxID=539206 RepID=UPI00210BFF1B|nr:glycosyltransferase [Pedobacter xinjiangensis]
MVLIISFISLLFTVVYVAVVFYLRRGWFQLPVFRSGQALPVSKVSILIAARNEEDKIPFTIEDILKQNYPSGLVELIIVDDHSTDRTSAIVESYADKGVKLLRLNEDRALNSYKKKAITEAINLAQGEIIITTDADCRMGSEWLRTIVAFFEENNCKMVSSPVSYFNEKGLFERLQTLEFLYLIGLGASSIGNKMPSTCNGANLAYRRDVFFELQGFHGIDDLASGDDELFLHKVASRYPEGIGFCKSRLAIVFTDAKPNLREFIRQRKRWASKSTRYKNKKIVALGITIWLFNVNIILNAILAIFQPSMSIAFAFMLTAKLISEFFFLKEVTQFAKRAELLKLLPLLTIIHTVYMIYIGVAGNTGKYIWKGRLVR